MTDQTIQTFLSDMVDELINLQMSMTDGFVDSTYEGAFDHQMGKIMGMVDDLKGSIDRGE